MNTINQTITNFAIIDLGSFSEQSQVEIKTTGPATWYWTYQTESVPWSKVGGYGTNTTDAVIQVSPTSAAKLYMTGETPANWIQNAPWLGDKTYAGTYSVTVGNAPAVPEPSTAALWFSGAMIIALLIKRGVRNG